MASKSFILIMFSIITIMFSAIGVYGLDVACNDTIDNDEDTWTDWPDDIGCLSSSDDNEFNIPSMSASMPYNTSACYGNGFTMQVIEDDGGYTDVNVTFTWRKIGDDTVLSVDTQEPAIWYETNVMEYSMFSSLDLSQYEGIVGVDESIYVNAHITGQGEELGLNDYTVILNNCTPPPTQCSDSVDNDGDGATDLADSDCTDASDDSEYGSVEPSTPQCSDSVDNDGDGDVDMADSDCSSPSDNSEYGSYPEVPPITGESVCEVPLFDASNAIITVMVIAVMIAAILGMFLRQKWKR